MCGIAGIIYRNGNGGHRIGRDMTRMLQSMKHRGPDSTGLRAVPRADARSSCCASSSPTRTRRATSSSPTRCGATAAEVERALARRRRADPRHRGCQRLHAQRSRSRYDGELKTLADHVESVTDVEVLSAGPRAGDRQGPRRREHRRPRLPPGRLLRQPRDRPRADGDRVRRRHLQRSPLLGIPVLRRRGRAQRPADQLPPVAPAAGAGRAPVRVGVRLGDHRRVPGRADSPGRLRSRTRCARASRSSTACSPTSA